MKMSEPRHSITNYSDTRLTSLTALPYLRP